MATSLSESRLYSCREAAAILNVSDDSIRRMIHAGDLEAIRIGQRSLRVLGDSIANYIHKNKGLYRPVVNGRATCSVKTADGVIVECEGGAA